jgi:signal transduction histidine kinase
MSRWICIRRRCLPALIILCLMASLAGQAASPTEPKPEPKRVLLLHASSGANLRYATSIRAEFDRRSPHPLEIYDASFVTGRPGDEAVAERYGEYLGAIFPDQNIDLAVVVGGASVRLYNRFWLKLFPNTPLLAIAEERRLPASKSSANETTIATAIDFSKVVENMLRVLPETTSVAVIVGNSSIERYWVEQMRAAFEPFTGRVTFTWLNELSLEEILRRAATLPRRSAIFFGLMLADAAGVVHEEDKVFSMLHAVANAPIFSYYDGQFGKGIIGGPLISVQDKSSKAVSVALRILGGEAPAEIDTPAIGLSTPKFDWREMQRWGISEARLTPGSEIQFRTISAWAQYRVQILSVFAAILLQAALIAWLIYEHRQRHLAEVLARASMSELTQMNRIATAGELSASIAHEVNQPLTGIAARAAAGLRWLAAEKPDIEKTRAALTHIVSASHRASDIIKSVRAMFGKDANERLPLNINRALLTVLSILRIELSKNDVVLRTELNQELAPVAGDQVQLQQVILNLVVNAIESMQSAPRRELRIRSELIELGVVRVSIEDTGPGIDPANISRIFKPLFTTKSRGMGMGLSICETIIKSHHGRIWVTQGADGGANFQFELPCCSALMAEPIAS